MNVAFVSPEGVEEALADFKVGLQTLTYKSDMGHSSKACLVCDRLLQWNDDGYLSIARLRALKTKFVGHGALFENLHSNLKRDYTFAGAGHEIWMDEMFLSPRGVYSKSHGGFQCCQRCVKQLTTKIHPCRVVLPRFAIANGAVFGEAPIELTNLNDVELALVSKARTNKHVFSFYGGAHKCMRGWHNLYENDVDGIARTLNEVSNYGGDNIIMCILLGPFTPLQKRFISNKMLIRPDNVLRALVWLKANNILYKNLRIPSANELAKPLIIDNSEDVASEDTNIEARMEYTVVFPETDQIRSTNGGCMTQSEFRRNVVDAMDTTCEASLISRPTTNRLMDYNTDALLMAFPLQFPYGVGLPPKTNNNRRDGKHVAMSNLDYLQHLQHQSVRHFHRGDFILVLHNMYERQRAVSVAFLRAKNNVDNESLGEHIAGMSLADLKNAIDRTHAGLPVRNRVTSMFLRSVDAVCKSMGHTNDAAKAARLKMLGDTVRFGVGALFLTVTPDDSNSLRIQIYVQQKCNDPPDPKFASTEEMKADFDLSVAIRQTYPGMCAFDFQQITELMIEHILGWNRVEQTSYANGGVFGVLQAWNAAVEEQSRKTLHSHWILYVKDWSQLLNGLYSKNKQKRKAAAEHLRSYIDNILSTKLFGSQANFPFANQAYKHKCTVLKPPMPDLCSDQDLRNLRYSHGQSSFKGDKILKCSKCEKTFSSQELVDNVMQHYFRSTDDLRTKGRLVVKRYASHILVQPMSQEDTNMATFMTNALTNLHASAHANTCFKKGNECRNKLPQRSCNATKIHFDDTKLLTWWSWMGKKTERVPFSTETERHPFDVFMNQYHPQLSEVLGCNTNVQCGTDGGHLIYVTLYLSKSTTNEDKFAYCLMSRAVYNRIRRREEAALDGVSVEFPFLEGYRTLLSAILSHTDSVIVSATMAWFIMRNQSRFLFSHDYAYAPFDMLLKKSIPSRIIQIGANTFLLNRVDDYVYRPYELHHLNWYEFVAGYDVVHLSEKNKDEIMRFSGTDHPLFKQRGVIVRKFMATPLVSYLDFPCSSEFDGNIMLVSTTPNAAMEKFAHAALCLFVPFRDENAMRFVQGKSFTQMLQRAVNSNALSRASLVRLQNIQNVHNMMKAGRQKDVLEKITESLPDPSSKKTNCNYNEKTQQELENHIELCMTELVADMDEDNALPNANAPISLHDIRKHGKDNCGYEGIRAMSVDSMSCVFDARDGNMPDLDQMINDADSSNRLPIANVHVDRIISKARLAKLSIEVVRRHVAAIGEVEHINPNGHAKSISQWAEIMFADSDTGELDTMQQRAFEVIVSMFVLTFHDEAERNEGLNSIGTQGPSHRARYTKLRSQLKTMSGMQLSQQLIMFLTGPGGSGKTRVINAVLAYAKGFCKELNYVFDKRMIVVTALTGVAATLINGETLHSAAKFCNKKITTDHIDEWKNSRMIIIDEISFATSSDLSTLNDKLGLLKETIQQKYGHLHVVFTGDFSQLEPVSGKPLYYETNFAPWHDWVNCFIELSGQHRFKDDPRFGAIMKRLRDGIPTDADIALLNTRVINGDDPNAPKTENLPDDITYAVYRNQDRSAINNGVFAEHLRKTHSTDANKPPPLHTLVIRSDDLTWTFNKKPFGSTARHALWSQCADSDVKTAGVREKYVDTFLKLTTNMPLMYTENDDVPNGIANGTLCHLVKVVLHANASTMDFKVVNIDGYYVRMIDASKVDFLVCKFANSNQTFHVAANHVACKINMPIELIQGEKTRKTVRATVNRFPVLINYATTGHKLQGQTKSSLCISEWHYGANWPYVVLSRVKTLQGLFLRTPLRKNYDFSHDRRLTRMLTKMHSKIPQSYDMDDLDYL